MKPDQPSAAQQAIGDFGPKLAELSDDVLFGDVSERPQLSKRYAGWPNAMSAATKAKELLGKK